MEKKYYIPIKSTSLPHYFAGACICPANYYENKPKDIQDNFPNVILLTSNFGYSQCDCCLEVIITSDEEGYIVDIGNKYYLIDKILPISRVCKIFFCNKEQLNKTVSLTRQVTAFIPDKIIGEVRPFENTKIIMDNRPGDFEGIKPEETAKKRKHYDSFLGALALMKVAKHDEFNVSPNYIDAVAFFNTLVRNQKEKMGPIKSNLTSYFENPDRYVFSQKITEDVLFEEARRRGVQIKKDPITKVINVETLKWPLYDYAILCTYGVADEAKRKKIDELILNNFQKDIRKNEEERIAFFYGYNRGYTIFNNTYLKDNKSVDVKFRLDSRLDYYIIESVYQYVFNGKNVGELPYIDSWCSQEQVVSKVMEGEYIILDKVIRDKKKVKIFSEEWWKIFIPGFSQNINFKINMFGKEIDLTEVVEYQILRPFATVIDKAVREELSNEYESELNNYKAKIEELEKQLLEKRNKDTSVEIINGEMPITHIPSKDYESLDKKTISELKNIIRQKAPTYRLKTNIRKKELIQIIINVIMNDNKE